MRCCGFVAADSSAFLAQIVRGMDTVRPRRRSPQIRPRPTPPIPRCCRNTDSPTRRPRPTLATTGASSPSRRRGSRTPPAPYGAFTFYRQPAMKTEQIGTKAASANERILFFRSNVLIDATSTSHRNVRLPNCANSRHVARGLRATAANLPNLPQYLPKKDAVENSARYVLGPQALLAAECSAHRRAGRLQSRSGDHAQEYSLRGRAADADCARTIQRRRSPANACARCRAARQANP